MTVKAEGFSQIAFQDNHGESAAPLIFQETRAVSPAQWMQGPAGGVGIYVPMVHWHGPGGRAGAAAGQRCIPHVWSRPTSWGLPAGAWRKWFQAPGTQRLRGGVCRPALPALVDDV